MPAPLYKNGIAAQVGDIIAVSTSGQKSQYIVVGLTPVTQAGAGGTAGHPETFLAAIPYDPLKQTNIDASRCAVLWSDFQANGNILG